MARTLKKVKQDKQISNIPLTNNKEIKMAKLVITENTEGVDDITKEAVVVLMKILAYHYANKKNLFFGNNDWKAYLYKTFPDQVKRGAKGPWLPLIFAMDFVSTKGENEGEIVKGQGALQVLLDLNYIKRIKKQFKNGSGYIYTINPDALDDFIRIMDNNTRDYDDQLMAEIEEVYKNKENKGGFKSTSQSFSEMGFTQH